MSLDGRARSTEGTIHQALLLLLLAQSSSKKKQACMAGGKEGKVQQRADE